MWDLFDLVICLVIDNETLRQRLNARTDNAFGQHPEELAAALAYNDGVESTYRGLGATIIDGTLPVPQVADMILAAAKIVPRRPDQATPVFVSLPGSARPR